MTFVDSGAGSSQGCEAGPTGFRIYIAASFRHLNGVRLLANELRRLGCSISDWTEKAAPPPGLTAAQRRIWMDTDQDGGEVFKFCHAACLESDLVIYYGESGQDAGVEVGLAVASGTPVLGIRGPLESPGLMLHGAVTVWAETVELAIEIVKAALELRNGDLRPEAPQVARELAGALMRSA